MAESTIRQNHEVTANPNNYSRSMIAPRSISGR